MRRKLLLLAAITFTFFLAAGSLYSVRDLPLLRVPTSSKDKQQQQQHQQQHADDNNESHPTPSTQVVDGSAKTITPKPPSDGRVLSAGNITLYLDEILGRKKTDLPNLTCPTPSASRYKPLQVKAGKRRGAASTGSSSTVRYFFAIDLRQNLPLLPRLLGSVVQVARFLGPDSCALSIVEGNSDDGTSDVLEALVPELRALGIRYTYRPSSIDPSHGDRIAKLAALRNLALEPLVGPGPNQGDKDHGNNSMNNNKKDNITDDDDAAARLAADANTTILFLNDVAACPDDILELLLQKSLLHADMTCGMDWTYVGQDPTFYDVWVARAIHGDSFFDIPPDGNWNSAWNVLWNEPESQARLFAHQPFQVFACWNGAAAITARPFLEADPAGRRLAFRAPDKEKGECAQGEPQLLCKDLWHRGFGRIAVVPAVNLEYSVEKARMIKELKGFTADNVRDAGDAVMVDWRGPPEQVKCMPSWENQFWRPWNETLS